MIENNIGKDKFSQMLKEIEILQKKFLYFLTNALNPPYF